MRSLLTLLLDGARDNPDGVVLTAGTQHLTWAELDRCSDRVGAWLIRRGIVKGDRVGLLADRSIEAVIGIFGTWKARASYVPLDPMAPPARNRSLLVDCGARCLLSTDKWMRRTEPLCGVLPDAEARTNLSMTLQSEEEVPKPDDGPRAEDLATILYTSGSTGTPKGVMLGHGAILAFVDWAVATLDLGPTDRISGVSPLQFDLSTLEIFGAMAAGGTACIAPAGVSAFPENLARFLQNEKITCWYSVPSVLIRLNRADLRRFDLGALREIPFAGEIFPCESLRELMHRIPHARFHNFFGPTESNVCVALSLESPPEKDARACPIGQPASDARIEIRDANGQPVSGQARGELWVSGPSLMDGYWGDPETTSSVLVEREGLRWLRTGDEVSEHGGHLWFHGRLDSMLKVRGFRLHPEEVEHLLCSHPGVRAAVVAKQGEELVAWVESDTVEEAELARLCRRELPSYMVPSTFRITDALPRTGRGKLSRPQGSP